MRSTSSPTSPGLPRRVTAGSSRRLHRADASWCEVASTACASHLGAAPHKHSCTSVSRGPGDRRFVPPPRRSSSWFHWLAHLQPERDLIIVISLPGVFVWSDKPGRVIDFKSGRESSAESKMSSTEKLYGGSWRNRERDLWRCLWLRGVTQPPTTAPSAVSTQTLLWKQEKHYEKTSCFSLKSSDICICRFSVRRRLAAEREDEIRQTSICLTMGDTGSIEAADGEHQ